VSRRQRSAKDSSSGGIGGGSTCSIERQRWRLILVLAAVAEKTGVSDKDEAVGEHVQRNRRMTSTTTTPLKPEKSRWAAFGDFDFKIS